MSLFARKSRVVDRITPEDIAQFGRYEFLGSEQSGVDAGDAYGLIANLNDLVFTQDPADRAVLVAELHRHAEKGEWEKVGAWKYVREFLDEQADTIDLIDGGLLAIHRMRVTNLAIHLAPVDTPRYAELTGAPPLNDGFFGPPVFDSDHGPTRQYYFDHAIATAAARRITRLSSAPGVDPGPVTEAAKATWDFGLLVYRGPLVANSDIRFEPNVVRPLIDAATNVDHGRFADKLADAVLDQTSFVYGVWSSLGAARFIEESLDSSAVQTEGYRSLLDSGLAFVVRGGLLGVSFAADLLTPLQRRRLDELAAQ